MKEHRFSYRWNLKDSNFTKDKGKVFSCFSCAGGSTMGYKKSKKYYIVLCDESNLNLELDKGTWSDFADFIEETLMGASITEGKEVFIIRFQTIVTLRKALQSYMQSLVTIKHNYYKIPYNRR